MTRADLQRLTAIYGRCIVLRILEERDPTTCGSDSGVGQIGSSLYCLLRHLRATDAELRAEVDRQGRARVRLGRYSTRVLLTADERRP